MASAGNMVVKLMVNKASNSMVWAECDSEFVDVLFSFLTMPMGTIIHLCGKETKMGCMDVLYQSVEELDERYFQNKVCKVMLLRPRSPIELKCVNLAVNVANPTGYCLYGCPDTSCRNSNPSFSYYSGCQCSCGRIMDGQASLTTYPRSSSGVFVQRKRDFLVRDDLQVIPVVATSSLSILEKFGITDGNCVEGRDIEIGLQEALRLLNCALHSQTALTDAFLSKPTDQVNLKSTDDQKTPVELGKLIKQTDTAGRRMTGKLIIRRSTKQVLYLEATEDLVNQILSFLTFPLGFVLKIMREAGSVPLLKSCVSNIYEAVSDFSTVERHLFNSEESKTELLSPGLGCFMSCDDQLLIGLVEAETSQPFYTVVCSGFEYNTVTYTRYSSDPPCSRDIFHTEPGECKHRVPKKKLKPINPKLQNAVTERGGGFTKINTKYIITDDLSIKPLSSSTLLHVLNKYKVTTDELEEQDISIGEEEAVKLLRAAMTSKTVLTDVFCPKKEEHQVLSLQSTTVSEIEEQFVCL